MSYMTIGSSEFLLFFNLPEDAASGTRVFKIVLKSLTSAIDSNTLCLGATTNGTIGELMIPTIMTADFSRGHLRTNGYILFLRGTNELMNLRLPTFFLWALTD